MKFFMSLTIIIPRKRLPTLLTLKGSLPSMTPQMAPLMKAPGKPLATQITRPWRRCRRLHLFLKRICLIHRFRVEKLLVLLQVFV